MSDVRRFPGAEAVSLAAPGEFVELTREAIARDGRACVAALDFSARSADGSCGWWMRSHRPASA